MRKRLTFAVFLLMLLMWMCDSKKLLSQEAIQYPTEKGYVCITHNAAYVKQDTLASYTVVQSFWNKGNLHHRIAGKGYQGFVIIHPRRITVEVFYRRKQRYKSINRKI
jgi:hypothetical protein